MEVGGGQYVFTLTYPLNLCPPHFLQLLCSLVFGSAAMLFKEHGATVFGVCLAYDILIVSRKEILRYEKGGGWGMGEGGKRRYGWEGGKREKRGEEVGREGGR